MKKPDQAAATNEHDEDTLVDVGTKGYGPVIGQVRHTSGYAGVSLQTLAGARSREKSTYGARSHLE